MKLIISKTSYCGNSDQRCTSSLVGLEMTIWAESTEETIILNLIENNPKLMRVTLANKYFWEFNPKAKNKGDDNETQK